MQRKPRPALTLLAVEDEVRAPSKPQRSASRQLKSTDDSDESVSEESDGNDELETSCDIGETTLRKGSIHINRTGVTFVAKAHDDDVVDEEDLEEPLYRPSRKVRTSACAFEWLETRAGRLTGVCSSLRWKSSSRSG